MIKYTCECCNKSFGNELQALTCVVKCTGTEQKKEFYEVKKEIVDKLEFIMYTTKRLAENSFSGQLIDDEISGMLEYIKSITFIGY